MTKYYYTCPIKAAYMAKEFGVKFQQWLYPTIHSTKEELCNVSFLEIVREIEFSQQDTHEGKFLNRYIIAPESQDIFEAKEFDIGIGFTANKGMLHNNSTFTFIKYKDDGYWFDSEGEKSSHKIRIIMRDNKEFFMPEVENDN